MKKEVVGLGLSVVATGLAVSGVLLSISSFEAVGLLLSIVSYILAGGISSAFKWALKFGKIGWYIVPFPLDILAGVGTIIISICVFLCVPVVFVYSNYRKTVNE